MGFLAGVDSSGLQNRRQSGLRRICHPCNRIWTRSYGNSRRDCCREHRLATRTPSACRIVYKLRAQNREGRGGSAMLVSLQLYSGRTNWWFEVDVPTSRQNPTRQHSRCRPPCWPREEAATAVSLDRRPGSLVFSPARRQLAKVLSSARGWQMPMVSTNLQVRCELEVTIRRFYSCLLLN